jgi:adenylate cyclase
MTEPNNVAAVDAFLVGQRTYSINAEEELRKSLDSFELATRIDPNAARAWSGIAYNLVQLYLQGWEEADVLARAEAAALRAVQLDPNDYFTQSYLGFYYLNTDRPELAVKAYETALNLNDDDRTVFADAAEALIYVGRIDDGIEMLKRARRVPDWHRWDMAWAHYLKGRQNPTSYDDALAELEQLYYQPDDKRYLIDIDLLYAAIYAQKDDSGNAASYLQRFLTRRPNWTAEDERRSTAFSNAEDLAHWIAGITNAGLPDPTGKAPTQKSS